MKTDQLNKDKIIEQMRLVIPAMILCLIGDYCIGIEPADSKEIGVLVSTGWATISDIRIAISNIGGMIGTFLFGIGAVAFMKWLSAQNRDNDNKWDRLFLDMFYLSLCSGCISFIYFHIACGSLIQHYNVLYEVSGNDAQAAGNALMRMFMAEAVPFIVLFVMFDVLATVSWAGLIIRKVIKLPKIWIIAAPLLMAATGQVFELLPLPFRGIGSGFETLGWMLMFIGGIRHIRITSGDETNETGRPA